MLWYLTYYLDTEEKTQNVLVFQLLKRENLFVLRRVRHRYVSVEFKGLASAESCSSFSSFTDTCQSVPASLQLLIKHYCIMSTILYRLRIAILWHASSILRRVLTLYFFLKDHQSKIRKPFSRKWFLTTYVMVSDSVTFEFNSNILV